MVKKEILKKLNLRKHQIGTQAESLEGKKDSWSKGVYDQLVCEYNFLDILLLDATSS